MHVTHTHTLTQLHVFSVVRALTEHLQANDTFFRGRSVSSDHTDTNSETEHSERSPLVSAKLDSLAKFIFNRTLQQNGEASGGAGTGGGCSGTNVRSNIRECSSPTRLICHFIFFKQVMLARERNNYCIIVIIDLFFNFLLFYIDQRISDSVTLWHSIVWQLICI